MRGDRWAKRLAAEDLCCLLDLLLFSMVVCLMPDIQRLIDNETLTTRHALHLHMYPELKARLDGISDTP